MRPVSLPSHCKVEELEGFASTWVYRGINAMLGDQWWHTMPTSLPWTGMANHGSYNILQDISAPHQLFSRVNYNYKMLTEGFNLNAEPSRSLLLNKSTPVEEEDI